MINIWFGTEGTHYFYIALVLGAIVIPLCLIRKINKLSSLHFLGDIAVLATVISLAFESIYGITKDSSFSWDNLQAFKSGWALLLGMSITSLEGIGVILPIKENMKEKEKFPLIIIFGTMVVSTILIGFPLIMYICYQDDTQEIVLNNLPLDKLYIQLILCLLIFSIIIVYPVQLYPAFKIFENILFFKGEKDKNKGDGTSAFECSKVSNLQNLLRIGIVVLTVVVGVLSIGRFDTLLSLAGCAVCTPIALIFPSYFHYSLFKNKQSKFRNITDLSMMVLGITMSLTVLVFTLI
jgi:proton-coupled amino acid transporter